MAYGGILGQQNQTGISGVWRTGNSFTQTDSGPSIGTPAVAASLIRRHNPFPRSQSDPGADNEHRQERKQLFGGAAVAIFAGVDIASRSAGARATGRPGAPVQPTVQHLLPRRPPTTDAYGNGLAQTQRYQKQLDELQKGLRTRS